VLSAKVARIITRKNFDSPSSAVGHRVKSTTKNPQSVMRRVGLDCRTVLARKTGDRTYTLNLLHGLAHMNLDPAVWRFHLLLDQPDTDRVLPQGPPFQTVVLRAPNSRLWTLGALPLYSRRAQLDVVHLHYLGPRFLACPFVTTIHDVVWRAMPDTFPPLHREIMARLMPDTARRAARIITVSHASKNEIVRYLRVPPDKVSVTWNSVEPHYHQVVDAARIEAVREKYAIGAVPYVLSVGVQQPRKNVARLIGAFAQVQAAHPEWPLRLVIAGKKGWDSKKPEPATEDAAARIQQSNTGHQPLYIGYVPDEDLPVLYAGAAAFAYPSLYEGFGLPILEAMACGCPVVTSNCSSMPEVAGEAAQLVDPFSIESIAHGLAAVLGDASRSDELRRRGRERAAQFTPERQAAATLDVYTSVLR
jgi:glycosyltransferase involved in cell wall biosynthesis